ncbi:MAG TPA: TetR/AcrR family transcriptional regulator [Chitinophagaceae bacterium]|nr:TetR/AcrR family transcriptional regulator [Chitinophagaceae bacterium]
MTVASRKQREKEEMRTLILDAARRIFLEKGYDQASIRNIAEQIEYSPGTIYLYFKEKDEIFHALHEEGFSRLLTYMQPLQHVAEPFERLKAMGKVYMQFALENKDFYDLMFIMQAPMKHEKEEEWKMGHRALNYLKDVIRDCQATGRFQGKNVEYLSFTIWSAMHGMCALYCRERCQAYHDVALEPMDLMENGFKIFTEMLEKG